MAIIINKRHNDFDHVKFVVAARSDDETRYFMDGVHVEAEDGKNILVATDGRRLHLARLDPIDGLEPGEYVVLKATGSEIILDKATDNRQFPNWRRVMPKAEDYAEFAVVSIDNKGAKSLNNPRAVYKIFHEGFTVNLSYLFDIVGDYAVLRQVIAPEYYSRSIHFKGRNLYACREAVLMPMSSE